MVDIARLVIGLVFLLSSIGKLRDFTAFVTAVERYQVVPQALSRPAAIIILAFELLITCLAFVGYPYTPVAFGLAIIMLIGFISVISFALVNDIETSCNCFGQTDEIISVYDIWRNVGIIALALTGLGGTFLTTDAQTIPSTFDMTLIVPGACMATLLLINTRTILEFVFNE